MWSGIKTPASICMHMVFTVFSLNQEVMAESKDRGKSTGNKMVVGLVAGIGSVVGILAVFIGMYCYCCTNCCASKPKKVQPRPAMTLPPLSSLPPPGSVLNQEEKTTRRASSITPGLPPLNLPPSLKRASVPNSSSRDDGPGRMQTFADKMQPTRSQIDAGARPANVLQKKSD